MVAFDKHIYIESLITDKLFKIYDNKGHLIHEFGNLIHDQVRQSLSASGDMLPLPKTKGFIFVPERASYIFYFNEEGKRVKTIQTLDKIPFKKSVKRAKNNIRSVRPPSVPIATYTIGIFKDKLYLSQISFDKNASLPKTFLDVYTLQSGAYLYSVAMPVPTNQVTFTNDTLYLLTRNTERVKAYAYQEP